MLLVAQALLSCSSFVSSFRKYLLLFYHSCRPSKRTEPRENPTFARCILLGPFPYAQKIILPIRQKQLLLQHPAGADLAKRTPVTIAATVSEPRTTPGVRPQVHHSSKFFNQHRVAMIQGSAREQCQGDAVIPLQARVKQISRAAQ